MKKFTCKDFSFEGNWIKLLSAAQKRQTFYLLKPALLILFVGLQMAAAFGQSPIGKPGKAGDFEIDGDFISGNYTAPGLDWRSVLKPDPAHAGLVIPGISTVAGENAMWIVDGNSGIGTEKEVFRGSSNKNGDFIGLGQSPYAIETQSPSAPQKNDITNVYARAKSIGTGASAHQWIMLAAETRSVDGTSYLDFEYNQAGVHKDQAGLFLIGDGPLVSGGRTAKSGSNSGDLLFVVDFSKGGNSPIPRVFEWRPTGKSKPAYDWIEFTNLPASVFIVTNGVNVAAAGLNTSFAGDGTPSNTSLALQLVEIGVDLTDLGVAFDNPCNPAATLTAKTRTSSSYTSELKDFSTFQFSLVPPATVTDPTDLTKCPGEQAQFSSTAAGSGASAANIHWYKVTGTAPNEVETEILTGISTSGLTSTLTISSVTASDAGKYRVKLTGATCGALPQDAMLTVNTLAALTNLTAQVKCPGATETATFSTDVSGTGASASNVEWYFGATKLSNGTKYTISASGNTSTLTINGIVEADEGSYKAKLVNATCNTPEKTSTLTVNPVPDANAGADPDAQCYKAAGNEFSLDGSASNNGTAHWTILSPSTLPAGVNVSFDDANSFTPKVTVSGSTSNGIKVTLRLTVTSNQTPACGTDFDDVAVEVKAQAQGRDGSILLITCTDVGFKLKITSPDPGTTYTVTQPCNSAYSNSTPTVDGDGNYIFENLKFAAGYKIIATKDGCEAAPVECGGTTCTDICPTPAPTTQRSAQTEPVETINARILLKGSRVIAAPNPFSTKLRFQLLSDLSGQGSLELYNMLGQKVQTVFQGYVEAGRSQTIDYSVPAPQRTNLVYVFRVGDQMTTGKLIGQK